MEGAVAALSRAFPRAPSHSAGARRNPQRHRGPITAKARREEKKDSCEQMHLVTTLVTTLVIIHAHARSALRLPPLFRVPLQRALC